MWECGHCGASFAGAGELETHRRTDHGDRAREDEPRFPASSPVKGIATDAQSARTGPGRPRQRAEDEPAPHPTGMTEGPPKDKDRGRTP